MKESDVLARVRLALQDHRVTTFRNNVGVAREIDTIGRERFIRYGLCEGSSDLIGFYEYTVRPEDVGRKIAVFTAIETKRSKGGRVSDDQWAFIGRVQLAGGIAGPAKSAEEAVDLVRRWKGAV